MIDPAAVCCAHCRLYVGLDEVMSDQNGDWTCDECWEQWDEERSDDLWHDMDDEMLCECSS